MRVLYTGLLLWLAAAGLYFAPAAGAATLSAGDARAVQLVVRAQLEAFADDDAELAFSFAAAPIRTMFGTPENFLQMVRSGYPVVYRPATVTFLKPVLEDKVVVQPVQMTDGLGGVWVAVYRVLREKDKVWRIAGCALLPQSGKAT